MKLAEQVQRRFLPESDPKLENYDFFSYYNPTYDVGGDFYDFVPRKDGQLAIVLADVSGKGISAALMMAKYSGETRMFCVTEPDPASALAKLNDKFSLDGHEDRFITVALGYLDPENHVLTIASAAHPLILIRRADGTIEEIGEDLEGFPLGVMPGSQFGQVEIPLLPGDVAVLYSDGVPDACNAQGERYDSSKNRRLLRRVAHLGGRPRMVVQGIYQDIREFAAGHDQADDISVVCLGRKTDHLGDSSSSSLRNSH